MTQAGPAFIGNCFVGAAWRQGVDEATLRRIRGLVEGWSIAEGPGWLLACEKHEAFADQGAMVVALSRRAAFDRDAGVFLRPNEVAAQIAREGPSALRGMAPPFRAAWAERNQAAVHAETDIFGLGQVFTGRADRLALAGSSATLLARILNAPTSMECLTGYALFGGFIGNETPFTGIDKLPAGTRVTLTEGRIETAQRSLPAQPAGDLVGPFRAAVAAMLKAAPAAEVELSGGLDSRMILAAMPDEAKRGRQSITIGVVGEPSEDVTVARRLASDLGLDWSLLDAGGIGHLDADGLEALLSAATAAYDHMANPLDKAALIVASQGRRVDARFGGQNGEILRGFYYPTQPLDAAPSEALARGLISMRLQANDKVEDTVWSPAVAELRAEAESRMARMLLSFDGPWGRALDQFYLYQRMQNWVGNATGHRLMDHAPLYPFFDASFVAGCMARPPAEKLNSRAAYALLVALDPGLAARPLAGGIVPAQAVASGRLSDLWLDAHRIYGRISRKVRGRARPTLGSQTVTQHWRRLGLHSRLPIERLARTGLISSEALHDIANGTRQPSRATLGFLLLVGGLETSR